MDNRAAAHRLGEKMHDRDFTGMGELFAPDAVLVSPVTPSFRFHGRDQVLAILRMVREVFEEGPEYEHIFGEGDLWAQVNRSRVRGREVHAVDFLRFGDDGLIREMTIFVRPLPGLAAFTAALAAPVGRRRGRLVSLLLGLLARPLAPLTYYGDKLVGRLLGPAWGSTSSSTRSS